MKALTTFTAALLITLSLSAFADDKNKEVKRSKVTISLPSFNWGSPDSVHIEEPATSNRISLPDFIWGSADEAGVTVAESAKIVRNVIALPAFVWGEPADIL